MCWESPAEKPNPGFRIADAPPRAPIGQVASSVLHREDLEKRSLPIPWALLRMLAP